MANYSRSLGLLTTDDDDEDGGNTHCPIPRILIEWLEANRLDFAKPKPNPSPGPTACCIN